MNRTAAFFFVTLTAILPAAWSWWTPAANASPFQVVATGQLHIQSGTDEHDLEGAMISIVYGADTTDTQTRTKTFTDRTLSEFDVFSMTVEITGRPNAAPDVTSTLLMNDPIAENWFPPATKNDNFGFDSRIFRNLIFPEELLISFWLIDLGSQTFFPGTGFVSDLSFFSSLGPILTPERPPELIVEPGPVSHKVYDIENLSVTLVPEPSTLTLAALALLALLAHGRRRRT